MSGKRIGLLVDDSFRNLAISSGWEEGSAVLLEDVLPGCQYSYLHKGEVARNPRSMFSTPDRFFIGDTRLDPASKDVVPMLEQHCTSSVPVSRSRSVGLPSGNPRPKRDTSRRL